MNPTSNNQDGINRISISSFLPIPPLIWAVGRPSVTMNQPSQGGAASPPLYIRRELNQLPYRRPYRLEVRPRLVRRLRAVVRPISHVEMELQMSFDYQRLVGRLQELPPQLPVLLQHFPEPFPAPSNSFERQPFSQFRGSCDCRRCRYGGIAPSQQPLLQPQATQPSRQYSESDATSSMTFGSFLADTANDGHLPSSGPFIGHNFPQNSASMSFVPQLLTQGISNDFADDAHQSDLQDINNNLVQNSSTTADGGVFPIQQIMQYPPQLTSLGQRIRNLGQALNVVCMGINDLSSTIHRTATNRLMEYCATSLAANEDVEEEFSPDIQPEGFTTTFDSSTQTISATSPVVYEDVEEEFSPDIQPEGFTTTFDSSTQTISATSPVVYEDVEEEFSSDIQPEGFATTFDASTQTISESPESRRVLGCGICFDDLLETYGNKHPVSTICGHLFCLVCIMQVVEYTHKCPICSTTLSISDIHPVYL